MAKTVDFYRNVLGMPLIKSLDLPGGMGQHFFFDAGNGDCVAFFWFVKAPDRVPGISSPEAMPGIGDIVSPVSTMNHLAFHVPAEKFDEYRRRLKAKGVRVGPVLNHDESDAQVSSTVHPGVYVRSFYFLDPDRRAVNKSHAQVYSLPESQVSYNAFDKDLQLWVAACLYKGF